MLALMSFLERGNLHSVVYLAKSIELISIINFLYYPIVLLVDVHLYSHMFVLFT